MNEQQKARVLIVEDEKANRVSMIEILAGKGFAVTAAEDGASALKCLSGEKFDIMLIDYSLPDTNGIEIIKKSAGMPGHPVPIMITGMSSLEVALEGMRLGVHDYLVKPVNFDELAACMGTILKEREIFEQKKTGAPAVLKTVVPREDLIFDIFKDQASSQNAAGYRSRPLFTIRSLFRDAKRFLRKIFSR